LPGQLGSGKHPAVSDLHGYFAASLMDGLSHLGEPRKQAVIIAAHLQGRRLTTSLDVSVTRHNQAHAALGQFCDRVDQFGSARAILAGYPHPRSRPYETVGKL
jgi:hypothetical protein